MQLKVSTFKRLFVIMLTLVLGLSAFSTIGPKAGVEQMQVYAASVPNPNYSLAGAVYYVYTDAACTTRAKNASGADAVLTTTADGTTNELEMNAGTYYVKEAAASKGYILDAGVYTVVVTSGGVTWVNGTAGVKETPQSAPIKIQKTAPVTGKSFEGTRFELKYSGGADGLNKTWIVKTNASGYADLSDAHFVAEGSDERYKNSKGEYVVPLGTLTVKEIAASSGFTLNSDIATVTIAWDGASATSETTKAVTVKGVAGASFDVNSTKLSFPNKLARGTTSIFKTEERKGAVMSGIPFVIKSVATGEAHVVVTNSEGWAFTKHSLKGSFVNANANDTIINADGSPILNNGMVDSSKLNAAADVWFSGAKGDGGEVVNNTQLPLPVGKYTITELPVPQNKGYRLQSRTVDIAEGDNTGEHQDFDNKEVPPTYNMYKVRKSDATDNGAGKFGFHAGELVTYDVVIENPNVFGKITLDVTDEFTENPEYFSKPFVIGVKNATQNKLSADKNKVNITVNKETTATVTYGAYVLEGAKEYLAPAAKDSDSTKVGKDCNRADKDNTPDDKDGYENTAYTTSVGYKDDETGKEASLPNKEDEAQTPVKIPGIGTYLADTAGRKFVSGEDATLVDTISYKGLTPGKTYVFEGKLMVKDSGDPLVENGKPVTAVSSPVVPTSANGTAKVSFKLNANNLQGKQIVAFETAYMTKEKDGSKPKDKNNKDLDKVFVAKHEDLNDANQTVEVPDYDMYKIRTDAAPAAKNGGYGFEPSSVVTYNVVITNKSKLTDLKMDVTDQFVEHPEYFGTPSVKEVKNATENSRSGNRVNITVKAGQTATVVYQARINLNAVEYLANAAKDSDSTKAGKDCNRADKDNTPDDKDGYKNIAKTTNVTPEDPTTPTTPDSGEPAKPLKDKEDDAQTPVKKPTYEMYKVRVEDATAKGEKFGFEIGMPVSYNVVVKNTSDRVSLRLDVTDNFDEKPDYFTDPVVKAVNGGKENSRAKDGRSVNISLKAGETSTVTFESRINLTAEEYLAAAAKDSDSLDKDGKDTNRATKVNDPDDKDGYKNSAKAEGVPEDPDNPDPEEPTTPVDPKEDDAQTPVKVPEIATFLKDDAGRKSTPAFEETVLVDTVDYKGFTPGQKYAIIGTLMNKETGEALTREVTGENGEVSSEPVKAMAIFIAENEAGSVELKFTVDTSALADQHVVAFERAFNITDITPDTPATPGDPAVPTEPDMNVVEEQGRQIAKHEDINDEDQTIKVDRPEIATFLANEKDAKTITAEGNVTLIDSVAYRNLVPGQKYVVIGELMDKKTGENLDVDGETVIEMATFTAEDYEGFVDVEFTINAKKLGGKSVVAFETAYNVTGLEEDAIETPDDVRENGRWVAEHRDIEDKDQTVKFRNPKAPDTGDTVKLTAVFAFLASTLALLLMAIRRRRMMQR